MLYNDLYYLSVDMKAAYVTMSMAALSYITWVAWVSELFLQSLLWELTIQDAANYHPASTHRNCCCWYVNFFNITSTSSSDVTCFFRCFVTCFFRCCVMARNAHYICNVFLVWSHKINENLLFPMKHQCLFTLNGNL